MKPQARGRHAMGLQQDRASHPPNLSALLRVQLLGGRVCALLVCVAAGEPVFPSLRTPATGMTASCHLCLVVLLLGASQARKKSIRSRNTAYIPSSVLWVCCSSQSVVVSKRLSAATTSMGWEAALVPVAMA